MKSRSSHSYLDLDEERCSLACEAASDNEEEEQSPKAARPCRHHSRCPKYVESQKQSQNSSPSQTLRSRRKVDLTVMLPSLAITSPTKMGAMADGTPRCSVSGLPPRPASAQSSLAPVSTSIGWYGPSSKDTTDRTPYWFRRLVVTSDARSREVSKPSTPRVFQLPPRCPVFSPRSARLNVEGAQVKEEVYCNQVQAQIPSHAFVSYSSGSSCSSAAPSARQETAFTHHTSFGSSCDLPEQCNADLPKWLNIEEGSDEEDDCEDNASVLSSADSVVSLAVCESI